MRQKCIFAFSFGCGEGNDPGCTNLGLSEIVHDIVAKDPLHYAIFSQWEIADELISKYGLSVTLNAKAKEREYLSTSGVIQQFNSFIQKRGVFFDEIIVVAHKDHAPRILRYLQLSGFDQKIELGPESPSHGWKSHGCDKDGYWENSSQPWTRDRAAFLEHEGSFFKKAQETPTVENPKVTLRRICAIL